MLPYGYVLLIIMIFLCKFTMTQSEISLNDDKDFAYANNFAVYAKGLETGLSDKSIDKSKISDESIVSAIQKYRAKYYKLKNWKIIVQDKRCYIYAEPTEFLHNSPGNFQRALQGIYENSANVGTVKKGVIKNSQIEYSNIPESIPEGSTVIVYNIPENK